MQRCRLNEATGGENSFSKQSQKISKALKMMHEAALVSNSEVKCKNVYQTVGAILRKNFYMIRNR